MKSYYYLLLFLLLSACYPDHLLVQRSILNGHLTYAEGFTFLPNPNVDIYEIQGIFDRVEADPYLLIFRSKKVIFREFNLYSSCNDGQILLTRSSKSNGRNELWIEIDHALFDCIKASTDAIPFGMEVSWWVE